LITNSPNLPEFGLIRSHFFLKIQKAPLFGGHLKSLRKLKICGR
jgi:hypothetical protein